MAIARLDDFQISALQREIDYARTPEDRWAIICRPEHHLDCQDLERYAINRYDFSRPTVADTVGPLLDDLASLKREQLRRLAGEMLERKKAGDVNPRPSAD